MYLKLVDMWRSRSAVQQVVELRRRKIANPDMSSLAILEQFDHCLPGLQIVYLLLTASSRGHGPVHMVQVKKVKAEFRK